MKRNYTWMMAAILGTAALTSCGDSGQGQQQNPAATAVPVNDYKVTTENVTGTDTYPGTVVALNEVELRPQVAGYITNIYVNDGDLVKKGQRLYEIDQSKYQASYNQAQANLNSAKANLARVQKDLERYERLSEKEAIAQQRVDYARTDVETARAQVKAAQAQVASASTDLGYSTITAPFDGRIGISKVRIGAQVSPGQPLLNTIAAENPIAVDFVINEQEVPRFMRLMQANQSDSLITIKLADGSTYKNPGKISAIDRAIGRQSGTMAVRVTFQNEERQLISGMSVNVNVLNADIGQQVTIPYKAVTEQMGEYFVYVIKGDSVNQQNVKLGTRFEEKVVVQDGLKAGESIVLEGIQRLRQGAKVQVGAPQQPTGPAATK